MAEPATTWSREEDGLVRIGVTAEAAAQLGDVIHFEPPELGSVLVAGHSFGELESVKAIVDVLAPVAGEVVEVNATAVSSPESVSDAPDATWLIAVRPS